MTGYFEGRVRTEWLHHDGDDRDMLVLEPFAFTDSTGVRWTAGAGDLVNGASIPRIFWTLVGSPFVGDYRRASVLHDVACRKKTGVSRDVHRMFYEAMRADGVDGDTALKMYTAVRLFGPNWERSQTGELRLMAAPAATASFAQVQAAIDTLFPSNQGHLGGVF